jgi:hypothetical protein
MAYSSFTKLKKVIQRFGISVEREDLFSKNDITPIQPSEWLKQSIELGYLMGYESEKERSERLVSPILAELTRLNQRQITIYSGHDLEVDKALGLNGETDYLMVLGKKPLDYITTPLFSVVEAKRQDMEHGTAQCTAQMIGAVRYNEADGVVLPYIYGATTDGEKWRFLRFKDNTLRIHERIFYLDDLPNLLGFIQHLIEDCKKMTI